MALQASAGLVPGLILTQAGVRIVLSLYQKLLNYNYLVTAPVILLVHVVVYTTGMLRGWEERGKIHCFFNACTVPTLQTLLRYTLSFFQAREWDEKRLGGTSPDKIAWHEASCPRGHVPLQSTAILIFSPHIWIMGELSNHSLQLAWIPHYGKKCSWVVQGSISLDRNVHNDNSQINLPIHSFETN